MTFSKLDSILRRYRVLEFAIAISLTMASAISVSAHEFKAGDIVVDHPWSRATPDGARVGGGYMKLTNNGSAPDRLLGGSTALAGHVEIHEMKMDNGIMRMRGLPNGLLLPPGSTVELKPGSYHVMFMQLAKQLKSGEPFKAMLKFEKAGNVEVEFKVEEIGAADTKMSGSDKGATHGQHKH